MRVNMLFIFLLLVLPFSYSGFTDHPGTSVQPLATTKSAHGDQGHGKLVRISGTTIVVANRGTDDEIYRWTGSAWQTIGKGTGVRRGTMVTGPDNMVYLFWMNDSRGIVMTRFRYDGTPSRAVFIHSGLVYSNGDAASYHQSTAAFDEAGNLYLVTHYNTSTGYDDIWFMKSTDRGNTWTAPGMIYSEPQRSFFTPHMIVRHNNELALVFNNLGSTFKGAVKSEDQRMRFMKSADQGETWSYRIIDNDPATGGGLGNPVLIESKAHNLFVFAQKGGNGLWMSRSADGGLSWTAFREIFYTGGYGDPGAAIGSDGAIYVSFRSAYDSDRKAFSDNRTICPVTIVNCWKNIVMRSMDEGVTWTVVDKNLGEDRTGPLNDMRYQTWWNYGGPLEWVWEQWLASSTTFKPTFYDMNTDVTIYDIQSSCGNGVCEAGESCSADSGACIDNICYEPTCSSGCGQSAVAIGLTDESCHDNTGCTGGSCKCDGLGACESQLACTDTCASLGFECGSHTICGIVQDCGICQSQFTCASGLCCHKSDTDLDGCVEDLELLVFIDRWKASSADVSMFELLEAIKGWKESC